MMTSPTPVNAVAGDATAVEQTQEEPGDRRSPLGDVYPEPQPDSTLPSRIPIPDPVDPGLEWDCRLIIQNLDYGMDGRLERRHSGVSRPLFWTPCPYTRPNDPSHPCLPTLSPGREV